MAFDFYKESYSGAVKAVSLGKSDNAVTVGGETCYPFYLFEGDMPYKPKIAMEVWDMKPDDWAEAAVKPFEDVIDDPAAWAKKCVEEYGADMIVLQLRSTDPNDKDASPDEAAATVKKVLAAVNVPIIVWGTAAVQKDEEVLKKVAEVCQGENLVLGPVEDANHKGIGAAAMGFGHAVVSSSPIDVNLAKQVNILLENLGMPMNRVIIDPTTGGLGYGMEYSYSVMERLRMAAMQQGDDKLQFPVINNLSYEVWKSKEAKEPVDAAPTLGDPERRGVMMEAVGAVTYLMAGSDILVMRHPEAVRMVRSFIDLAIDGGSAMDVAPVAKRLAEAEIDMAALSPAPDLTIVEEKKAEPVKAAPKAAKPAAAPKQAPAAAQPAAPAQAQTQAQAPAEATAAPVATVAGAAGAIALDEELLAKLKAMLEADKSPEEKAAAEAKAKAEEESRKKAEAAARAKAEEEALRKARAEQLARLEAEEIPLRQAMAKDREVRLKALAEQKAKHEAEAAQRRAGEDAPVTLNRLMETVDWVNRRT